MNRNRIITALSTLMLLFGIAGVGVTSAQVATAAGGVEWSSTQDGPETTVNYSSDGVAPDPTVNYAAPAATAGNDPMPFDSLGTRKAAADPYWYLGFQFRARSICLEGTSSMPLNQVAIDWRDLYPNLIIPYVRFTVDGCAASGFGPTQRVKFVNYNADDGRCGEAPITYSGGYVVTAGVRVNLRNVPPYDSCQNNSLAVYNHEFGHTLGFNHVPDTEVQSIMRPAVNSTYSHPSVQYERPRLFNLYGNNPLWP